MKTFVSSAISLAGYFLVFFGLGAGIFHYLEWSQASFIILVGLVLGVVSGKRGLTRFILGNSLMRVEAQFNDAIDEVKELTNELRFVMGTLGSEAVKQVVTSGRWGGGCLSEDSFDREKRILEAMRRFDVPTKDISEAQNFVRPYHIVDYFSILSSIIQIRTNVAEFGRDWNGWFEPSINQLDRPTAEAIRQALPRFGVEIDDILEAWLQDYAHFRETGEHRRPDEFRNRDTLIREMEATRQARV